jgi:DNA protecting protein DprA
MAGMDQVIDTPELEHPPAKPAVKELGLDREAIAFLGMSRLKGVGFHKLSALGGRAGICKLLDERNVSEVAHRILPAGKSLNAWEQFRQKIWAYGQETMRTLTARKVQFMFAEDRAFPRSLVRLSDKLRPQWLFVAGNVALLEKPSLTIVGTRSPTEPGEFLARYAVSCAREANAPVISGLAHGIDRLVHEWCLRLSLPTISVLGTGILAPYPAKHAPLNDEIVAAGGAVLTEYLPTQGPSGQQFVWRNRLQAALGCATIPVEWKRKSGTAHTVRFSRALGKPVIGLRLDGANLEPDAGEADTHFHVPRDHTVLIDALRKALAAGAALNEPIQSDLFN